jgi:hypothetical protein
MTIVFPPPLESAAAYEQEIARIEQEIAATEKHLGQLRRERGCRVLQLEELQTPGG